MNKKIFAAFLAAMMAVGAVGCGDVKDGEGDSTAPADSQAADTTTTAAVTEAPAETTTTVAEKALDVDEAAKNVGNEIEKAQKAALGELEGGYKAVVTYTPAGSLATEKGVKPVTLTMEAKQKDKLTGITYELGYDSKGLLTLNAVYDNEKEVAYASVPELSDGVLTGSSEDIKEMVQNSVNPQNYGAEAGQAAAAAENVDFDALKNIDYQALSDDIATYIETFKENFPEGKDAADYTVSADGVEIALKTKSFTVTPEDTQKLGKAISDKGMADATLKDVFKAAGVDDEQYKSFWDTYANVDTESASTTYFDIYYTQDDAPAGIAIKSDETTVKNRLIVASSQTDVIIDCDMSDATGEKTAKGHINYENETLNGQIVIKNKTEYSNSETTVEYKNLTATDEKIVGNASITQTTDGEETMKVTYSFDATSEGGTVEMAFRANGEDLGTVKTEMQKTDASDITIPTGTTYKMTDSESMQKYTESCDVEGWQENVKKALGEDLYNDVFAAQNGNAVIGEGEAEIDASADVA